MKKKNGKAKLFKRFPQEWNPLDAVILNMDVEDATKRLTKMKSLSFDLIVTSPPYNIGNPRDLRSFSQTD